ncbi:MAG TPA: hypothetical protein VFU05_08845 [Cyclobacteriaceae bacterium]|nr:hypothetical protein [Cyclobacteriaceae bacterium]
MNTQTFLHISLVVHLIALTMVVGITIANAVASHQFWKLYDMNREHGLSAFKGIKKLQLFGMLGLLLLIFSGILMLWLYNWAYGEQLWFQVKMTCLVLILVNGFTMGRITTLRMEKLLKEGSDTKHQDTQRLRRDMKIFQLTQLSLFMIIIVLASFRFV